MNNKKIIDKIKKLLSLAESNNVNEARLARQRALKLIAKNGLKESDFNLRKKRRSFKHYSGGNNLVRFISDNDGEPCTFFNEETLEYEPNKLWCLVDPTNFHGLARFCTQEFFGEGESDVVFECKRVKRGGITCPDCLEKIRTLKAINL